MPRGNVWLILIVIASMLGVWYFGFVHPQRPPQATAVAEPEALAVRVTPSPASSSSTSPAESLRRTQLQNELAHLQSQLGQKTQELENQKATLGRLQQQQNSLGGTAQVSSQMQTRDLAIQNLLDDLSNYHQAEEDINQSASLALKNQDSQAALARTQVDMGIQSLEQAIRNTQSELKFWQMKPDWEQTDVRPQEIQRLQTLLDQQTAQLNGLRSQRVSISASALSNTQVIQSLAEQAKAELRNSAASAQTQIFSLRGEMDRIQRSQAVSQGQLQGLNQQISRAEKDLEARTSELQRLQEAVQSKQNEIQAQ